MSDETRQEVEKLMARFRERHPELTPELEAKMVRLAQAYPPLSRRDVEEFYLEDLLVMAKEMTDDRN